MVVKSVAKDLPVMSLRSMARDSYSNSVSYQNDTTDMDIAFNLLFSSALGLLLMVVYVVIRPKFLRLYASNHVGAQRPRLPGRLDGYIGWMKTVWSVSDRTLLGWSGLDAFVIIQLVKLLIIMSVCLGAPMFLVLLPAYYFTGPSEISVGSIFFRLSILNCRKIFLWIPALVSFLITGMFYYLLYAFYRRFSILRQAYLRDPSALTSASVLQNMVQLTGSIKNARALASLHSRAALLAGVDKRYDEAGLKGLLDQATMGPVGSISFISSRADLCKAAEARNKALKNLESAVQEFLNNAIDMMKKEKSASMEKELDTMKLATSIEDQMICLSKLCDPSFFPQLRPTHEDEAEKKRIEDEVTDEAIPKLDSISTFYNELMRLDEELEQLVSSPVGSKPPARPQQPATLSDAEDGTTVKERRRLHKVDQVSLVNLRRIAKISKTLEDLKLTRSDGAQMAIVLFDHDSDNHVSQKKAAAFTASLLSRRPFSLTADHAPSHRDILWDNVQMSAASKKSRYATGMFLYVVLNVSFIPVVSLLNALSSLDKFLYWVPALDEFLGSHTKVKAAFQGILVPFIMNLAFSLAPVFLRKIAVYQGLSSKSRVEYSMLNSYGSFLFFQSFVVITLSSTVLDVLRSVTSGQFGSVFEQLRSSLPSKALLFTQMFIQRTFILPQSLLKPIPLLMHIALRRMEKRSSPRKLHEAGEPSDVEQGSEYPGMIVYAVQVLFAFMTFSPVLLLTSLTFFIAAYYYYRTNFLYTNQVKIESGGIMWSRICDHLLVGLALNLLFTSIHFSFRKTLGPLILTLALLMTVPLYGYFLHRAFRSRCVSVPQTEEDEDEVEWLLEELYKQQALMIREYGQVDESQKKDAEFLPVCEIVSRKSSESKDLELMQERCKNPYNNPVLFKKLPSLMLDPLLFPCMKQLESMSEEQMGEPNVGRSESSVKVTDEKPIEESDKVQKDSNKQ